MERKKINNYKDLDVYMCSYDAAIRVITKVIPSLPPAERFDLADQLRRSVKAVPRLIAEGYGKRHQNRGFQKYLDDALSESNETIVGLEQCRDIYGKYVDVALCEQLVAIYDKVSRQLYRLNEAWNGFYQRRYRYTKPIRHFQADADAQ